MLKQYLSNLPENEKFPNVLVVGCGNVGSSLVKALVDNALHSRIKIYVTDSDKDRARKLSEHRLSSIIPVRWRYSHDTPDDVDVIVIAVDHDSEHKIIDRLALSKKPFVTLSDDETVFDAYDEYENEFKLEGVHGVIGAGLVPGISNVLVKHVCGYFDEVYDIVVERLGFVSTSSLDSLKSARKESPLSIRDGILSDSRRDGGSSLTWFPSPYDLVECQSVATGVTALASSYPDVHNISVRFAEPKLPTFSERVRNVFLKEPLTTSRAAVRVEIHGKIDGHIQTRVLAIVGDAMSMIIHTCIMSIFGIKNAISDLEQDSPFISCDQVIESKTLLKSLHDSGAKIYRFDGDDN